MIPKRLREARHRAKLTQEKLAVMAGIDESTARSRISQYENGIYRPNFETCCAFARILDVPECYFYTVDDEFAAALMVLYTSHSASNRSHEASNEGEEDASDMQKRG
ncbi:helix-turn-helix transcriptional regulator [Acerihabitans arboris]|uniref:Helix-turn-helix domain-containing protein n=1 Tax=Acerihabitans arboris TaxID=2691583 RepID=A0A845SGT3_9GAMM|nr:helix-turn-helix transcriptional regulator [Acerihabitans arboris]NDL61841.1 helix-turn-helix domain-containing protein [Acerihabitans arboris]